MNPKIGIVTVLFKSETVLADFFSSLKIQTYQNFVLYIVDNKSPDNSLNIAKQLAGKNSFQTFIIENDDNYGVAKGNNIGIRRALENECDMILLSNNDITLTPTSIEALLNGIEAKKASLAVPKIYFYGTNQIWLAGGRFLKFNGWTEHTGFHKEDKGQYDQCKCITYAPTCFMLIRKEVFSKIGFMDDVYFVYWDDTDFVYRAIKQNLTLWYVPQSIVNHKESTSTGAGVMSDFSLYYQYRNLIYFSLKNYSGLFALYVIMFNISTHLFKRIFTFPYPKWKLGIKAYKEGFKLFFSSRISQKLYNQSNINITNY